MSSGVKRMIPGPVVPVPVKRVLSLLAVLLVVFGVRVGRADVFHLRNGSTIEGKIVERNETTIRVKTRFGYQNLKASDVVKIEKKETTLEAFERKRSKLTENDVDARIDLAKWCKKNGLNRQRKDLLKEVLHLDPVNAIAHEAFGRVLFQGRWMTPEEKVEEERMLKEATYRAKGLVRYKGQWVTKEERSKLEQGLILHKGKWLTEEEVKLAEGYVRYNNRWVKKEDLSAIKVCDELHGVCGVDLALVTSPRYTLFTAFGEEEGEEILAAMEEASDLFYDIFRLDQELWKGRAVVVVLKTQDSYAKYVEFFGTKNGVGASWIRLNQKSHGFYHWMPPASVDVMEGRHEETLISSVVHKVGHILINLFHFNYNYLPTWLDEGFAVFFERQVLGDPKTFCLGEPIRSGEREDYGGKKKGDYKESWSTAGSWRNTVRNDVRAGADRSLKEIVPLKLSDLSTNELAKASFLVEYLVDDDPALFARFVKEFRTIYPHFEERVTVADKRRFHEEAFQKSYRLSLDELDEQWRRYVKSHM